MMTRLEFLQSLGVLGLAAATGCKKDDDPTPTPDASSNPLVDASTGGGTDAAMPDGMPETCAMTNATISANHGHAITVPPADVQAGVEKIYQIQGSSAHPHTVTITAAQFTMLRTNGTITVMSSLDAAHRHSVTVTCSS